MNRYKECQEMGERERVREREGTGCGVRQRERGAEISGEEKPCAFIRVVD